MIIEVKKFKDVNRAPYNPRVELKAGMPEYEKLKKSIVTFGHVLPMVYNSRSGTLVGGHQTMTVLKDIGKTEAEMSIVDLGEAEEKALNIALNKIDGFWDDNRLSVILNELIEIPDFDIELTGFDIEDIDSLQSDIEKHNNMYKPGVGKLDTELEFIDDEKEALTADEEAHSIIDDKSTILIAFSGGRDSTFVMIWAKENFPDKRIIASFVDTGVEFPGVTAHVWDVCKFMDIECQIVKPDKDVWVYWAEKERFFNIIFPECQSAFIFAPLDTYYQTFDSIDVVILDGSRGDQARRTSNKTKTSGASNTKMKDYSYYHPCFNIDYDAEVSIIEKSGVPLWEGYKMGFKRSACWCCPAQSGEQAYALSQNYPGLVDVIRRWEKRLNMKFDFTNDSDIDHKIEVGRKKAERRKNTEMQA